MNSSEERRPRLGEMLLAKRLVSEEDLLRALRAQEERDKPLGEVLVDLGLVSVTALADTLLLQHAWRPLGRMLVDRGLLDEEQLDDALSEQQRTGRPLGEIVRTRYHVSPSELGDILAEQGLLELEMDRGFGTGLRSGIDRRQRPRRGEQRRPAAEEPVLRNRIESREAERDRLAVFQAALEQRDETIAALSSANLRRGQEIEALRARIAELEQRLAEIDATQHGAATNH